MADFSAKQFQELNEAYVSMYRTEEVVEETQEEILEDTEQVDENAMKGVRGPLHALDTFLFGRKKADAAAVRRGVLDKPSTPAATPPAATPKATPPAATPKADTPKPTPPKADPPKSTATRPIGGAARRTPTMGELRAAQAARAAGKSEKDVVKAGVAAGKPKVATRPVTPPPPVKKKSRLDTALSGIGKWSEEKESYDVVLEYLLSGGHAETVEEAHYIMLEMDQSTIKNICEEIQEG